ncbi:UNVERIFIED_CONTAM: hypothetical protein Slati_2602600 [Sesamum latifolium]|uniref:Uncharacterized protein n=1 Tax=Sesamum latifolium TaxID=2727402 RepID=A0AAW2VTB8_9LAMI
MAAAAAQIDQSAKTENWVISYHTVTSATERIQMAAVTRAALGREAEKQQKKRTAAAAVAHQLEVATEAVVEVLRRSPRRSSRRRVWRALEEAHVSRYRRFRRQQRGEGRSLTKLILRHQRFGTRASRCGPVPQRRRCSSRGRALQKPHVGRDRGFRRRVHGWKRRKWRKGLRLRLQRRRPPLANVVRRTRSELGELRRAVGNLGKGGWADPLESGTGGLGWVTGGGGVGKRSCAGEPVSF